MSGFIPKIGTRGIYTLLPPFATKLLDKTAYTCIAVRRLADIVAAGGDPKAQYYTPNSLSDDQYAADAAANVCIITLQAGSLSTEYIPSSFIAGFPDIGGVPYTRLLLAADLGALPNSLDLNYTLQRVQDVILENLGVTATVQPVAASVTSNLSDTEHTALTAARQNAITNVGTDYARLLDTQQQLAFALSRVSELEAFIVSLGLPATVTAPPATPAPTPAPTPGPTPAPSPAP